MSELRHDDARRGRAYEDNKFDVIEEARAFYAWLDNPAGRVEIERVLPSTVRIDAFIRTAKEAVQTTPRLLDPALRSSLLLSVVRAAKQGLPPDGKHGALVPRWDSESRSYKVAWQPMVWGIVKLGRQTGAIRSIRAEIAFEGEEFAVLAGEDDKIIHRVDPRIVDAAYSHEGAEFATYFWSQVAAAYCIITATDGTVVKRWMPRGRLLRVKGASKAASGPWSGPFVDEMIRKTVILYTLKWVDTDASDAMQRFREALETDMEAVLDHENEVPRHAVSKDTRAALPPPDAKLDAFEQLHSRERERVPVESAPPPEPPPPPKRTPTTRRPAAPPPEPTPPAREADRRPDDPFGDEPPPFDDAPPPPPVEGSAGRFKHHLVDADGVMLADGRMFTEPVDWVNAFLAEKARTTNEQALIENNAEAGREARKISPAAAKLLDASRREPEPPPAPPPPATPPPAEVDRMKNWADSFIGTDVAAAKTEGAIDELFANFATERLLARLKTDRPELHDRVMAAAQDRRAALRVARGR